VPTGLASLIIVEVRAASKRRAARKIADKTMGGRRETETNELKIVYFDIKREKAFSHTKLSDTGSI
jgi:hypothetical protein